MSRIKITITPNIEGFIKEGIYYGVRWSSEGIIRMMTSTEPFTFTVTTLSDASLKLELLDELNPGLIDDVKIH